MAIIESGGKACACHAGDTRPLSVEFVAREADGRSIDEEDGGRRRTRSVSPYRGRPRSRSPSYEPRRSPRRSPSPIRHAPGTPPALSSSCIASSAGPCMLRLSRQRSPCPVRHGSYVFSLSRLTVSCITCWTMHAADNLLRPDVPPLPGSHALEKHMSMSHKNTAEGHGGAMQG